MKNITVIGKNSKLYQSIKLEISKYVDKEYSHNEIESISSVENALIFSYDPTSADRNLKFLRKILSKTKGKIIYISSSSIYANVYCGKYKYPKIKKEIENYLLKQKNTVILRIGIVDYFVSKEWYHGNVKLSTKKRIIEATIESLNTRMKCIDAWDNLFITNPDFKKRFYSKFLLLCKHYFPKYFFLTRPLDILLKVSNFKNYGYTFLSNQFENHSRHLIIGSGMSALGTLEALSTDEKLKNSRIIHANTSKFHFSESSNPYLPIEKLKNGGNSNLWHSVISRFLPLEYTEDCFSKLFTKYFPKSNLENFKDKSSYVPYFPLRPLKRIKDIEVKLMDVIDDHIILIEKNKYNSVTIHGLKASYTTDKLFLCTGTFATLQLLTNSNFIEEGQSKLSEHLVGYFGQFNGPFKNEEITRDQSGHFKKMHEIKLPERSLFVSVRPANFKFRDIKTANEFRNFFGRGTKSIIISLISKFNFGLILEAIYNKLGIEINFGNKYNIVGHIESKHSVEIEFTPFRNPKIVYTEKQIIFTNQEITAIRKYFKAIGVKKQISINRKNDVSPGIHFLNSSLREELLQLPEGIKFYGTILFDDESPRHPSFDLLIYAYKETLKNIRITK